MNTIVITSMDKSTNVAVIGFFLALAIAAVLLAELHVALAWVGYPIAVLAAIVTGLSVWEYCHLRFGEASPPADGEEMMVALVGLLWIALVAVELITLFVVWLIGGLS